MSLPGLFQVSSGPSMCLACGLTRTRWTSGQSEAAAVRSAGRLWQETPLARIHFFALASSKPSMIRFHWSVQPSLTMQWISMLST